MSVLGQVTELWRYPLKSAGGEPLTSLPLGDTGARGDRRWAVQNSATGAILTLNTHPRLLYANTRVQWGAPGEPDLLEVTVPGGLEWCSGRDASEMLSAWLGIRVAIREWSADDVSDTEAQLRFDYGFPVGGANRAGFVDELDVIHIVSLATLRWMETDASMDARRTRANVILDLGDEPFAEDRFIGEEFALAGVRLEGKTGTERCQLIESPQPGLTSRPKLLERVRTERAGKLGIYARVMSPGTLHVGDLASA